MNLPLAARPVLLAVLLLALPTALPADDGGWLTRADEAFARAARDERYLLVDVWAEWCTWCRTLQTEVFEHPDFRAFAEDLVLLRVDVEDGGEGAALQARYRVESLPTVLVLTADRVKVGAVSGFFPVADYLDKLRAEITAYENLVTALPKVLESGRSALIERLAEDFHQRYDGRRAAQLYARLLTSADGAEAARLHYRMADALRLAGDFDGARRSLDQAADLARREGDEELLAETDFLRYYVAQDSGDCDAARRSLEGFLKQHPRSALAHDARRFLGDLRRGELAACSS